VFFSFSLFAQDGTLDPSFGTDGQFTFQFGGDYYAYDVAVQNDGKIVVVGRVAFSSGEDVFVMRLNPNGELDPTFQGVGFAAFEISVSRDSLCV